MSDNTCFTHAEAQVLQGAKISTTVAFSGVPKGTSGTVMRADQGRNGYTVAVQWELPGRAQPLIDWFSKAEFERYLQEWEES